MRTPVLLISGVDPTAMATVAIGWQFDLPGAVVVRHHIDVGRGVLTRVVSDLDGVVERHETLLEHACVTCAIREDIAPTLERLARSGRWRSIVAHLPTGAETSTLCATIERDERLARVVRVASTTVALGSHEPLEDLLGDDLLAERGLHSAEDDRRGVAEVLGGLIEHADVVAFDGPTEPLARGLVRALARPGALTTDDPHSVDTALLAGRLHDHAQTLRWSRPTRRVALPPLTDKGVWRVDLQSLRAFHPARLMDALPALGGGRCRTRGCFWLPARPGQIAHWDGAGGQLSVGHHGAWGARTPFTRIVMTGVGTAPAGLRPAFEAALTTDLDRAGDLSDDPAAPYDGFEPWLGPIQDAA